MRIFRCEVRQLINTFYDFFGEDPGLQITREEMLSKENQFAQYLVEGDSIADSSDEAPWTFMYSTILGEDFYQTFRTEIDSAASVMGEMDEPFWEFSNYDMEIRMPGRIISSNGYVVTDPEPDNGNGMIWTVKGEYFLTQDFNMWAESRINNYVMWIITAIFILFVITGLLIFQKRKSIA